MSKKITRSGAGQVQRLGVVLRWSLLGAVLAGSVACAPIYRNHGYVPTQEALGALRVGVDTKASVVEQLGSPTAEGMVTDRVYYYVQSRFEHFGPMAPKEIKREVLAISFAADGRLRNVERFGLEAGRIVPISRMVTSSQIADTTLLRQLMGNLGNVSAAPMLAE